VAALGTSPRVLLGRRAQHGGAWTNLVWWNMATGYLAAASLGHPSRVFPNGAAVVVVGRSRPGLYPAGHRVDALPDSFVGFAAVGTDIFGTLHGQWGFYDLPSRRFRPVTLRTVAGHRIPQGSYSVSWLPVWGPTFVIAPGGHQPWPGRTYVVPVSDRYPALVVPGLVVGLSGPVLVRTRGRTLTVGRPDAQGRLKWEVVGSLASPWGGYGAMFNGLWRSSPNGLHGCGAPSGGRGHRVSPTTPLLGRSVWRLWQMVPFHGQQKGCESPTNYIHNWRLEQEISVWL
jgi:hypothetical protein